MAISYDWELAASAQTIGVDDKAESSLREEERQWLCYIKRGLILSKKQMFLLKEQSQKMFGLQGTEFVYDFHKRNIFL